MSTEHKDGHGHGHEDDGQVHAHIGSYRGYFAIFMALIFFTLLTVGAASFHLGKANLAVAVVIASLKAALVCTFFMHLKDDNKFNTIILLSAITFIGVFFALTINDTSWRTELDTQSGARANLRSGDDAPGSWQNPIKQHEVHAPGAGSAHDAHAAPSASGHEHDAHAMPSASGHEEMHAAPSASAPMPSVSASASAMTPAPSTSAPPAPSSQHDHH